MHAPSCHAEPSQAKRVAPVALAGRDVLGHLLELSTMVRWTKQQSRGAQPISRWARKGKEVIKVAWAYRCCRPDVKLTVCPYENPSRFTPLRAEAS